jgi:hypothetical protein
MAATDAALERFRLGNQGTALVDVFADLAVEVAYFARVFAVLEGVPVALRRPAQALPVNRGALPVF